MTVRRKFWLCAALVATPLSFGGGWCWNRSCEPEYRASARVSIPSSIVTCFPAALPASNPEESLLSPEVVAAAADLLQEREIPLPVESRFDSEIDYLLNRLDARRTSDGDRVEIELLYRTPDAERAVAVLTAVVDAGVRALQSLAPEIADTGEDDRNRERAQLADAFEQQQTRVSELQERIAAGDREPVDSENAAGSLRALATSFEVARSHRIEAEDQLALAFRDVRAGVTVEQILARLPDGPAWSETRDLLGAVLLRDEIRQLEVAQEAAAALYGRNHPRMVGLRTQLEQTRQKISIQAGGALEATVIQASMNDFDGGPQANTQPVTALLLKVLEEKASQANVAEQELEQRLASANAAREERQSLEPQLADARQEMAFLQREHERVRQEIAAARHHAEGQCVSISEPPLLSSETIVPSLPQHLFWAGCAGILVSGGSLWQFQRSPGQRSRVQRSPAGRPLSAAAPYRAQVYERYHSQQEDNLARLRRLKPVA